MGRLEFGSNCNSKNNFGKRDLNKRYYCPKCKAVHYENPKPTAGLIYPRNEEILFIKRTANSGKGLQGLLGGFIEKGENIETATKRELEEETMLDGRVVKILETCSHFNTIFGDILLIGLEVQIENWSNMRAGDDAEKAVFFSMLKPPRVAFPYHEKIVSIYKELSIK